MKKIPVRLLVLLLCIGISWPQFSYAQVQPVAFEQLDSLQKREQRPVIIFLHTTWCSYCGIMKNATFKNDEIVKRVNQNFYFVSLDTEEKQDIFFQGHTFRYKPAGLNTGVHQLAEQLGTINGQLAVPALCFLNAAYEIIYQREGYIETKELLDILNKLK